MSTEASQPVEVSPTEEPLTRGQKISATRKRKKQEAEEARSREEKKVAAGKARRNYAHLQRLRLLPATYSAMYALSKTLDNEVERDILETVFRAVNKLRERTAEIAQAVANIADRAKKITSKVVTPTDDSLSRLLPLSEVRTLSDIRWLDDTRELNLKTELLDREVDTTWNLAWAAGYLVDDFVSPVFLRRWQLAHSMGIMENGSFCYVIGGDMKTFETSDDLWIAIGALLDAQKEEPPAAV